MGGLSGNVRVGTATVSGSDYCLQECGQRIIFIRQEDVLKSGEPNCVTSAVVYLAGALLYTVCLQADAGNCVS